MTKSCIQKTSVGVFKAALICPFTTALGRHDSLENVLFTVTLTDGTKGFGEAAVASHITGETVKETEKNLRAVGRDIIGRDVFDVLRISRELHERLPKNKSALAAVEMAVLDAFTRRRKMPLWKFFGSRPRKLKTDITVVISDLADTENTVKKFCLQGFRAFKVKIGRDRDADFKRVLMVKRLAPRCAIYLDANQGFSSDQTLRFLNLLKKAGIRPALVEQPVARGDWEGLKKVTRLAGVVTCADESASCLEDVRKIIRSQAAGAINIKLMKFGLIEARDAAQLAKKSGIKLMIGAMMETSLAITASAHLAAGLGGFDYIDLDTPFFIKGGLLKNPYLSSDGVYDLRKVKGGIGIVPQKAK